MLSEVACLVINSDVLSFFFFSSRRRHTIWPRDGSSDVCSSDLEPDEARAVTAVLCHPHPQHGGTMRNKVVTIMERSLRELGLRTLRFNFRGVGKSEGEFDDGAGELDDLLAVVDWVRRARPNDILWLGGFSFGGYIALKGAQSLPVAQLLTIAPPVERYGFADLQAPDCPWLCVQQDDDDVGSPPAG